MQGRGSARNQMPASALCMLAQDGSGHTRWCCASWWVCRGKEGWGACVERVGIIPRGRPLGGDQARGRPLGGDP